MKKKNIFYIIFCFIFLLVFSSMNAVADPPTKVDELATYTFSQDTYSVPDQFDIEVLDTYTSGSVQYYQVAISKDGSRVFAAGEDGVTAWTWNGAALTHITTDSPPSKYTFRGIDCNDAGTRVFMSYVYTDSTTTGGLMVWNFSGASFSEYSRINRSGGRDSASYNEPHWVDYDDTDDCCFMAFNGHCQSFPTAGLYVFYNNGTAYVVGDSHCLNCGGYCSFGWTKGVGYNTYTQKVYVVSGSSNGPPIVGYDYNPATHQLSYIAQGSGCGNCKGKQVAAHQYFVVDTHDSIDRYHNPDMGGGTNLPGYTYASHSVELIYSDHGETTYFAYMTSSYMRIYYASACSVYPPSFTYDDYNDPDGYQVQHVAGMAIGGSHFNHDDDGHAKDGFYIFASLDNKRFRVYRMTPHIYVDDNKPAGWYDSIHVKTIQEGIDNATEGQTVNIYPGIYNESVTLDKYITLQGSSAEDVFLNGSLTITEDFSTVQGIAVIGNEESGIDLPADYAYIRDCNVYNSVNGINVAGENNIFTRNIVNDSTNGINISGANNSIYTNLFLNNTGYGAKTIAASIDNLFYNNYFQNDYNAVDTGTNNSWNISASIFAGNTNILDESYFGGNYWDDYLGNDTDLDNFGDTLTPYSLGGVSDSLPLLDLPYILVDDNAVALWYDRSHVKTIQEGITNASVDEEPTVYVYPGTYSSFSINKDVTVLGHSSSSSIIDGYVSIETPGSKLVNMKIITGHSTKGAIVFATNGGNASFNNISDCKYAAYSWGSYFDHTDYNEFYGNTVYDLSSYAVYFYYADNANITYNTIRSNGFSFSRSNHNTIAHNVLWCDEVESYGIYSYYSNDNTYHSNYIVNYNTGFHHYGGSDPASYVNTIYNNFFNNSINAYVEDEDYDIEDEIGSYQIWNISKTRGENIIGGPYLGGNYWNDFDGYDTNGDYLGDVNTPYFNQGNIPAEVTPNGSYAILRPVADWDWGWTNKSEVWHYMEIDEEVSDGNGSYIYDSSGEENIDMFDMDNYIIPEGFYVANLSMHVVARATAGECLLFGFESEESYATACYMVEPTHTFTEYNFSSTKSCDCTEGCNCEDWTNEVINETYLFIRNNPDCEDYWWCDVDGGGSPMTNYVTQAWFQINFGNPAGGDMLPLTYYTTGPTNVTAEINGTASGTNVNITINWTSVEGFNNTVIVRNESGYATSWLNGTEVYNATGNTTNTPIMFNHYYTMFGYNPDENTYTLPTFVEFGAIKIECYNESNITEGLNFELLIRNESGSQTFNMSGCYNPTWIDYTWIPYNTIVSTTASSGTYRDRTITADLDKYVWANLIFYMNHGTLYYTKVIDEISDPIDDVFVEIYRFLNGSYQLIESKYTDPYGMAGFYLVPLTEYKGDFVKSGYNNLTETFDTDPYYYGYSYPIIFRMSYASMTPPDTDELFKNIIWSLEPNKRYHNNSFTIWFNITSTDNQLDYFRMIVWYVNETTGVNDLLDDTTKYTAAGGSINYTVSNITGKYKVDCLFKKDGFVETDVQEEGSRYYFISWGGLFGSEAFDNIPDLVFYIILIIIAAAITAFVFPFAGMGAGYIAMGILAFGFVLKPVEVAGVSCWAILAITALIYTIGLMLWSRI